jgi:hypothetical protein
MILLSCITLCRDVQRPTAAVTCFIPCGNLNDINNHETASDVYPSSSAKAEHTVALETDHKPEISPV